MGTRIIQLYVAILVVFSPALSAAEESAQAKQTLIKNVRIFDGVNLKLAGATDVLIEDNMIAGIGANASVGPDATVIDGGGRVLMPVRDMGGDVFGLKKAIDQGRVKGPRIYPSGATISQTAGHGDFRFPNQKHTKFGGQIVPFVVQGQGLIADGVKIMTGGGYSSPADPLLGIQYTYDEVKAAVDAASNWGTYVTMHTYFPESVNMALDAGVKDVGHGQLLDKKTLQRMAKEGVFLSTQPFTECSEPQLSDFSNAKLAIVCKGTANVYKWAKEIPKLKVTYGTDMFFVPQAGELFKMSGPNRDPYPQGKLGVVKTGAYADLLLVEGNPLEDLAAVTDTNNLKIIMKDGVIYKNTLD